MIKIRGFYPLWRLFALEALLDAQAERGMEPIRVGLLGCSFRPEPSGTTYHYRIGACDAKAGSASFLEYCLNWQKKGWSLHATRGKLCIFRASEEHTPEDTGLSAHIARAIHWRETLRNWMLGLAALCLVIGYPMDGFTVVRLAALPLAVALVLSWEAGKLRSANRT